MLKRKNYISISDSELELKKEPKKKIKLEYSPIKEDIEV